MTHIRWSRALATGLVLAAFGVGLRAQPRAADSGPVVPARDELVAPDSRATLRSVDLADLEERIETRRDDVQPTAGQDDFVPASQLPAVEQLPAAPMVIAAYALLWFALLVYVWSIWRRVQRVEREIDELTRRVSTAQE